MGPVLVSCGQLDKILITSAVSDGAFGVIQLLGQPSIKHPYLTQISHLIRRGSPLLPGYATHFFRPVNGDATSPLHSRPRFRTRSSIG
jgi:hypothetical protein